jgi:hypothetical protein
MNADHSSLSHHPAPRRHEASVPAIVFGLAAGPLAWFVQLCAGYTLASWPCFPLEQHRLVPQDGYAWTWGGIIAISVVAVIICVAAFLVSRRTFNRTRDEGQGGQQHLLEVGSGRTRFLALWGMVLGLGFAVATGMTAVAFFILPRCAG